MNAYALTGESAMVYCACFLNLQYKNKGRTSCVVYQPIKHENLWPIAYLVYIYFRYKTLP